MNRKTFLQTLCMLPIAGAAMKVNELEKLTDDFHSTDRMPLLFLGHGSPMNAIEDNEFVQGWKQAVKDIPKPSAILCVSAHWETKGTWVTAMQQPRTIHDFGGFPQALFDVQYPAKGSPELAKSTKELVHKTEVGLDDQWGLDHGCWSVVKQIYPKADIPVMQMSLDYRQSPQYHFDLAKELAQLRKKGVLIIGSGNMVHNLGLVAWDKLNQPDYGFDWAIEANTNMKNMITKGDFQSLINYKSQGRAFDLAIPTPDHFLPLLYALALKENNEKVQLFNDRLIGGSLNMTSVKISD